MKKAKIVIVEDEADILKVIEYNLLKEGFEVYSALDGEEGLALIQKIMPELVLLDLMIPGIDGLEICRRLKGEAKTSFISIIMVTAKGEESDIVLGLGLGADDYVTKPFRPRELTARVKSVLRRGKLKEDQTQEVITFEDLVIDYRRHEVRLKNKKVTFTAIEFKLLYFLASQRGIVFTREQLLNKVSPDDTFIIDRNIDVHILSIRKKLEKHRDLIETIYRVGYRFREDGSL